MPVLTSLLVSQHSYFHDCWITISNTVYNITEFVVNNWSTHPGGFAPTDWCGNPLTKPSTSDGYGQISPRGTSLGHDSKNSLVAYKIGTINQALVIPPWNVFYFNLTAYNMHYSINLASGLVLSLTELGNHNFIKNTFYFSKSS